MGNEEKFFSFLLNTDIQFFQECAYFIFQVPSTKTVRRGERTGVYEERVGKDVSSNLLSHLFEIFRSNTSIYNNLSDSGIIEIHLVHSGGFSVLSLKFAFLFWKEFPVLSFLFVP